MKTLTTLAAVGALAMAVPALADDTSTSSGSTPSAEQQCRTERASMGTTTFAQTYGTNKNRSNAFGKCVSKRSKATDTAASDAHDSAVTSCRSERTADPAAFDKKYGTNKNGKNAFGKCVSAQASSKTTSTVKSEVADDVSAAKSCRKERAADPAAFTKKYGTNKNGKNAFGKCVSAQAKAKHDSSSS